MALSHKSFVLMVLLLGMLKAGLCAPYLAPSGLAYPLEPLKPQDLPGRIMRGGQWLNGLPGRPSYNGTHVHAGIDLPAQLGEVVYAIAEGVVDPASDCPHNGYGPGWTPGGVMIIRSLLAGKIPYLIVYGHTQNHLVRGGDRVVPGQPIAEIGPWLAEEGGPHLHVTVRLGELSRRGWGTPTLPGVPLKDGAETAGTPDDVLALGYRDPLALLSGQLEGETAFGLDANGARDQAFVQAALRRQEALSPKERDLQRLPLISLPITPEKLLQRRGQGYMQYLLLEPSPEAMVLQDGDDRAYLVSSNLLRAYERAGGPEMLGYPIGEQQDWGSALVQGFEHALIVWEKDARQAKVILREMPSRQ